jgi:hypothetical protein
MNHLRCNWLLKLHEYEDFPNIEFKIKLKIYKHVIKEWLHM